MAGPRNQTPKERTVRAIVPCLLSLILGLPSATALEWPKSNGPDCIAYAHLRGLPDSIPVAVVCIRVDAKGQEMSRTNGLGHIKLEDWLENHLDIDADAQFYVDHGFVKMTVVYCGDVL